jgi:hypothetical protein
MSRTSTSVFKSGLPEARFAKSVAGNSNVTLTVDEARNKVLSFTGALTGSITVTVPVTSEDDGLIWVVANDTTGAFTLAFAGPSGNAIQVPQGTSQRVEWTGTNMRIGDSSFKLGRSQRKYIYEAFREEPATSLRGGGASAGSTGSRNILSFKASTFEQHVKGTQTLICPVITDVGLDIGQDQTAADGGEFTNGISARCPVAFVIGTDAAFQFSVKIKVTDASGANPLLIGFRKAEAYQATYTNYADYAYIGILGTSNPNLIKISTEAGGGGNTDTDTTQTWADGVTKTLTVKVSSGGVVTYLIDGAAPTATAAYTFTNGLTVVPSLFFLEAADLVDNCEIIEWECGYQADIA